MSFSSYVRSVESKGWSLYDIAGDYQANETWEERGERQPASTVEEGGMYLFVPQPKNGQTLREAYAVTEGLGPCLRIKDHDSSEYSLLALRFTPKLAVFTRFAITNADVMLFTPPTPRLPKSDLVVLDSLTAEETFIRDFDVISPEDFKKEVKYAGLEWHA